jgi:hypothetical protein
VASAQQALRGSEFNATGSDGYFRGGRFDSTAEDRYSYLYAAPEQATALMESLVRTVPFDDHGHRLIRREAIRDHLLPGRVAGPG